MNDKKTLPLIGEGLMSYLRTFFVTFLAQPFS